MNTKRRISAKQLILILLILTVGSAAVSLSLSENALRTTEYEIKTDKAGEPVKLVHLSDLHSASFGRGNCRLVDKVAKEEPDIICLTGDTVSSDETDFSVVAELAASLAKIAPVYVSLGNHETDLAPGDLERFVSEMEAAGAVVLEKEYVDLVVNGREIRIGGTSGYALWMDFWEDSYGKKYIDYWDDEKFSEQRFMLDFQATDAYKILLLHRPESATLFWADRGWYDVDLVLSGHTHGGQIRLPFIGGLIAPEEGWFPEFEYGYFRKNNVDIIISAGLGSSGCLPRFNNLPEVVSVTVGN